MCVCGFVIYRLWNYQSDREEIYTVGKLLPWGVTWAILKSNFGSLPPPGTPKRKNARKFLTFCYKMYNYSLIMRVRAKKIGMQVDLMVLFESPTKFLYKGPRLGVFWGANFIIKNKKISQQNSNFFQLYF